MDQIKRNRLAVWGSSRVGSIIREKIEKAHDQSKAGKDQKLPSKDNKSDGPAYASFLVIMPRG